MKLPSFIPFRRRAVAGAAAAPVMEGYRIPTPPRVKARRKRAAFIALFILTFFYAALFTLLPRALALPMVLPIVAIYLLAIWALPVGSYAPPPLFERLFWGFFVALMLWPRYLAISIPGLPWITMERLFGGPLIVLLLILASTSSVFRSEVSKRTSASRATIIMLSLFAANIFVSSLVATNPAAVLNRLINYQITWTGIFFATLWALRTQQAIHRFVISFTVMIFLITAVTVLEASQKHILWASHIPSFLSVDDPSVQRILDGSFRLGTQYRVIGTSTTPLSLAELLALSTPFICYCFVETRSIIIKALLVILDIAVLYSIIQTDSRMGLGGFVVGHAGYFVFAAIRMRMRNERSILAMATFALMPIAMTLLGVAILTIGRLRTSILGGTRHSFSNEARASQIEDGLRKSLESPIIGFGPGEGAEKLGYYNNAGVLTIDSYYLSILLDYGLIGFILFYGLIVACIVKAAKIALAGSDKVHHLAGVFAIFLFIFLLTKSVLSQATNHSLIFIGLGVIVSLSYLVRRSQESGLVDR